MVSTEKLTHLNEYNQIVSSLNEWIDDKHGKYSIKHNINRFCNYEHTLFLNEISLVAHCQFPMYSHFSTMTERYMDNYVWSNKYWFSYPILCKEYIDET